MKTFNEKEIVVLKEYLQTVIGHPTAFAQQKSVMGENSFCQWCEEWELIEMLKYLINGKDNYTNDPPPNRLKNSTHWSKQGVEEKVLRDLSDMETIEQIVNYFKNKREHFNESV